MLKNLEISGFKSFAKKGGLEFTSPISAIVGPNGSGKSNVAEAFRFVLGEQSLKSMRGKRGEDMIFSGTKTERALNRAGVKVTFDNSKRFLNIDYDDVIIERIVQRDGGNQYFINKSQVRLKDITELLAGANIGSSGHHIISQGESDRILSVNPKERKVIIEEALGLRVYQYKIIESERKLGKVEENIKEVQSLKREIAPHLRFLKRQVKKIEKSVELKEKLRSLYKKYFYREDNYLKEQKKYIEENKKPLENNLVGLDAELEKAKKVLSEEKNESKFSDEVLKIEDKLQNIRKEKDKLSRRIGQAEGMISFEERRLKTEKSKQKEKDEKVIKFKEVKSFLGDLRSNLDNYDLNKIKEIISDFIARYSQGEDDQKDIDQSELQKLENEKNGLEKDMNSILGKEKDITSQYERLRKKIEQEKDSGRKAEVKIFEINAKQSEFRSKLNLLLEKERKVLIEDENFKMELKEAFVLAGRESIQFQNLEPRVPSDEGREIQEGRRKDIERIKIKLEDMGSGSDEEIMKEYKETQERDSFLAGEVRDLEKSAETLVELIKDLKEKLDVEFREGVEKINNQFNDFFVLMFGGGKAQLKTIKIKKRKKKSDFDLEPGVPSEEDIDEKSSDELGIDVEVALPNKRTKGLQMLSGGERSLTSIALLFAMSQIKPPPFIILDETDAALDEANSKRYGDMIDNLSKYSQLILITHNRETMSRAGVLYGITMGIDGVSRLLSVKLDEAVKVAK